MVRLARNRGPMTQEEAVMKRLTVEELAELERLAQKAAAVDCPWSATGGWLEEGGKACFLREHALGEDDVPSDIDPTDEEEHRAETDAEFAAAASPTAVLSLLAMASRLVEVESALEFFAERGWWSAVSRTPDEILTKARELGWTSPTQKQGDR